MPEPAVHPEALLRQVWGPWRAEGRRRMRAGPGGRDEVQRAVERTEARWDERPRPAFNNTLPVTEKRAEIADLIARNQVLVVCGETGSGKTTQLPQICLMAGRGRTGLIGHTQPRRIAARTVANRIAEELGEPLGGVVGFKVRFGDQTSERTTIKIMTDGILLAETQGDRLLECYDTIIVDEAHERSLNVDFLLGYLKQLLPRRPDLKVIITSATIDPERFSRHFNNAPIITVSGRTYPVEIRYRPVHGEGEEGDERDVDQTILEAVDELTVGDGGKGDVLVFLPGEREIRAAAEDLRKHHPPGTEILPLYARLSPQDQMRAFAPHRGRRIVLATNVAETSLTVPGIRYVVDAGVARISRYAPRSKVQRLPIEKVSQASANQRAGRCGRVQAGVCIRLYSQDDYQSRPAFTEPEILRTNLASVILQMKSLHLGPIEEFPFLEPPDPRMIRDGYETLEELGAVDERGDLTKLGHELARLPIDPRLGRILLAGREEHCVNEALVIASALSAQDPRDRPQAAQDQADQAHRLFVDPESDFLTWLHLWRLYQEQSRHLSGSKIRSWCRDHFVSYVRMREWEDVHGQLKAVAGEMHLPLRDQAAEPDAVHRAVLAGLLSNIGAKGESFEYQGARGRKFHIFPGSSLFKKNPKWVVAAELVETTRLYARTVAKIQPEWAERVGQHVLKRAYSDAHWSEEAGQVGAFERVSLFGLTLVPRRRVHYGPIDPVASREIFIRRALVDGAHGDRLTRTPFMQNNRAVIDQVRHAEAKVRRADLLVDEDSMAAWYGARIPPGIHSIGAFEQWRHQAEKATPRVLFMSMADVSRRDPSDISPEQFPDLIEVAGEALVVEYRLDPGGDDDGLTVEVPIGVLPRLDAARLEWLVPGMLKEKILALLRALPKSIRATLDPVQALAETAAATLPFGRGSLLEALSALVEKERSVKVPIASWPVRALPTHMLVWVRVVDEKGEKLGEGRDVPDLQGRLAQRARKHLAAVARRSFGREGLTQWDFDSIPPKPEGSGHPALVDHGDSVALTLADTAEGAAEATHAGVRRFFILAARHELDYHLERQPNLARIRMLYAPMGKGEDLLDGLRCVVAERVFMQGGPSITTREQFESRQAERWGRIGLTSRDVAILVDSVLTARQRVASRLEQPFPDYCAEARADIVEQLALLCPPGFLRTTPEPRLHDYPRYLEALTLRLRKLDNGNWGRDSQAMGALRPLWRRCIDLIQANSSEHAAPPPGVREHRWLLEELRVSLFAERLGTTVPVSVKRLNDHWAGLNL